MSVDVKQEQKSMASIHAVLLQEQNVYSLRTLEHRAPKERTVVACGSYKDTAPDGAKQGFTRTVS
jgi:hypothetical protein